MLFRSKKEERPKSDSEIIRATSFTTGPECKGPREQGYLPLSLKGQAHHPVEPLDRTLTGPLDKVGSSGKSPDTFPIASKEPLHPLLALPLVGEFLGFFFFFSFNVSIVVLFFMKASCQVSWNTPDSC